VGDVVHPIRDIDQPLTMDPSQPPGDALMTLSESASKCDSYF